VERHRRASTLGGALLRIWPCDGRPDAVAVWGLGTAHGNDVQPIRACFKRSDNLRGDPHHIPLTKFLDFVIKQNAAGAGDDDVGLLLLTVTVRHRTAQVRRVAKETDSKVARAEMLTTEPTLNPGRAIADGVLHFQ
jgi:hypothetical protein